jgi:hypothetical protein
MVAGTAAEIGIAGTAAAAISRKRHKRSQGSAIKEVGLMEFRFQPDPFERVTLALSPDRYRSGFVAWQQRTVWPVHDAAASIYRAGSQGG